MYYSTLVILNNKKDDTPHDTKNQSSTEGMDQERRELEEKINETKEIDIKSGPDLEQDNFWGGGVNLGQGPSLSDDESGVVTKQSGGSCIQVPVTASINEDVEGEEEDKEEELPVVMTSTLPEKKLSQDSVSKPVLVVGNSQSLLPPHLKMSDPEKLEKNFSDEELSIVSNIDTSPVLNALRDKCEGGSPGDVSITSSVSELSQGSCSASRRRKLSKQDSQQAKQARLDKSAEIYLPEYFENDDHSVLSISSKSSIQLQQEHDDSIINENEEAGEGRAIQLKYDEWKIVPHKRAVMSPDVALVPRSAGGNVVFGTKINPSFDEEKILKREEKAAR